MKKILAIVLSCMLIVGVVFALVLTSSAEETLLDLVKYKVTGSDTMYELHDGDPAATVGEGTIEFVDGVLTLSNTTGLTRLELCGAADDIRTVTVNVEGVNTWAGGAGSMFPHHIKATFVGDNSAEDKLVISGAGGYLVLANSDADLTFRNVGVSVNATSGNSAVQLGTGSNLILEGNTTFHIEHVANNGLDIRSGTLTVRDTAQLTITSNGTNSINFNATTLNVVVEDSAKIVVTGNTANGTVNVTSLTVKDDAYVEITMPDGTRCVNSAAVVNGLVEGDLAGSSVMITAIPVPAVPANVAVSDITDTAATVTWDAVEYATSYEVYLGEDKVATVTETTAALTNLTAGTDYSVTVKAVNDSGTSDASAAAAFTTEVDEGNDKDVIGDYVAGQQPSEVIAVDIVWGALEFTYTDAVAGVWNPETHTYDGGVAAEWTCEDGADEITVINHSNVAVEATFAYNKTVDTVDGAFSNNGVLNLDSAVGTAVAEAPSGTVTLTLSGTLTEQTAGKVGTVVVTVD